MVVYSFSSCIAILDACHMVKHHQLKHGLKGNMSMYQYNTVAQANIVIKRPRSNLVVPTRNKQTNKISLEPCLLFYFTIPIFFFSPATVALFLLVFLYLFLSLSPLSIISQTAHPTPDLAKMFATFLFLQVLEQYFILKCHFFFLLFHFSPHLPLSGVKNCSY